MTDSRVDRLARVLVHYSLGLRRGQTVRISGPALAAPHIHAAYREALLAGAYPTVRVSIDGLEETYYKLATDEQIKFVSELDRLEVEKLDAELRFLGTYNTRALTGVNPGRMAMRREATRDLMRRFMERSGRDELHWCLTQAPTHADAQEAEMSLGEYEDFVYAAGRVDQEDPVAAWEQVREYQTKIATTLGRKSELRIKGPDIDLQLSVAGRTWISAAGEANFPDGEVFTGPVEESANGRVRFTYPAIYQGREVEDVELVFEQGRVVQARAAKGEEFLKAMLEIDPGARYLGEFAFGLNYSITRFTRNILFDEKIGGTLHMALGAGYPETGSKNTSGLHWDMICDLRNGAEVFADGTQVYRNAHFEF